MSEEWKTDSVRSQSSGTIGRAKVTARDASTHFDSSSRPQSDGLTNSEAFLGGISSCAVAMIEMLAEADSMPLKHISVNIEASRDLDVKHYQKMKMMFKLTGVSKTQADELVRIYQSRCPLYGTVAAVCHQMDMEVAVVPA